MKLLFIFIKPDRPSLWTGLLAFLVRFWFLQVLFGSPFFEPIPGGNDRSLYNGLAEGVTKGHFFPDGVFMYMPLYPWCLGLVYALVGVAGSAHLYAAGFLGALLDSLTTGLIAHLAMQCGASRRASAFAGLLYALYPTAVIYSVMTMANSLNALLLLLFAAGARKLTPEKPIYLWLGAGLLAGVTALSFAGMILIAFVGLGYWLWIDRRRMGALTPRLLGFAVGLVLPILPVTVHNWRAEGRFVLVTAHGGFNFYMGNHDGATGYPVQIAGFRGDAGSLLADARTEAEQAAGRKLKAAEFSQYWSRRAWTFIRTHPRDELRILGLKAIKFWNRYEYDDMRLLPMLRLANTAFTSPFWPGFGWIAWWGLMGLLMARDCPVLKTVTIGGVAGVIAFFITARYRLTFVPLLGVLGAAGFSTLVAETTGFLNTLRKFAGFCPAREAASRSGVAAVIALVVAALLVAVPVSSSDFRALDYYNTAAYLLARGRSEDALRIARAGLAAAGEHADLHFVAGNAQHAMRQIPAAIAAYEKALQLNPSHVSAHYNLALCWLERGDAARAEREIQGVLQLDPRHPKAPKLLEEIRPLLPTLQKAPSTQPPGRK